MNERRECLSFCLWESRQQAHRATAGASHTAATRLTARMYESYSLERYEVMKTADEKEDIIFQRIDEG